MIFLFITYTIIPNITSSEICALHLTHPSAHTPGAVGSQYCDARGAFEGSRVRCLVQGSHLSCGIEDGENARYSLPPPTIPAGGEIRTHNLGLQVRRSIIIRIKKSK